jgi:dienelactone hydrolase
MKLNVDPLVALCDAPLDISASEVPEGARVRLSSSMALPWAPAARYESTAWFSAGPTGVVDLAMQRPDSGSYDFVDRMGLIVSMRRTAGSNLADIARNISPNEPIRIEIVAESGSERTSVTLERRFLAPNVRRERLPAPMAGELFSSPDARSDRVVLVPTGSGGDLGTVLPIAALLASHGINALGLAYFEEEGLPSALARIPLEYFEQVFAWLQSHPTVGAREIEILGISKGGELALLLASRYPFVTKVAALAPHAYCFQGITFRTRSSWTYEGADLPFIRLSARVLIESGLRAFMRDRPFGYVTTYRKGVKAAMNAEAARIKVEESNADLLLFAGRRDGIWNSYDGCEVVMRELDERAYRHRYEFVGYEDAGHSWYPPYVIPCTDTTVRMAPRLRLSTGGTLEGNARAQADSWQRALAFLAT